MFLFIFNNSMCASSRDWLCHIMRGYTYIYTLKAVTRSSPRVASRACVMY